MDVEYTKSVCIKFVKKFYDFYIEYKFLLENESGQIEHLGYRNHN